MLRLAPVLLTAKVRSTHHHYACSPMQSDSTRDPRPLDGLDVSTPLSRYTTCLYVALVLLAVLAISNALHVILSRAVEVALPH